jgi:TolA-binding protein
MNRLLATALVTLALVASPVAADDNESVGVVEGERGSLESFFYGVWSRLKALSPRTDDARVGSGVIATAGLRGADDDNLQMEPYWKNDLGQDAAFKQQIEAYRSAIEQGEQGNTQALQTFLDQHGDSDLAANVQFGLAIAKVRAGKRDAARGELERFIDRYPEHPLVADAEALLQRLSG